MITKKYYEIRNVAEERIDRKYKPRKTYNDGVFRALFNDKEKLRELYEALSGEKISNTSQIEIETIQDVIYGDITKSQCPPPRRRVPFQSFGSSM